MSPRSTSGPSKGGGRAKKARPDRARRQPTERAAAADGAGFPAAFAKLLRSRKLPVPKRLLDASPEAYAWQPASFVEQLSQLSDAELRRYAEKVAGHAERQLERAKREWESSPLIAELRRRGLAEPPSPTRPAGVSVSLTKPLKDWSDKEILKTANDWSMLGSR